MQIAISHQLGREEVRRRLSSSCNQIADAIPGGMTDVQTEWVSEDSLSLAITVMGQVIAGQIDIADEDVMFTIEIPIALGFIKPIVESTIQQAGQKLLAPSPAA
jgi:hypothetical protein